MNETKTEGGATVEGDVQTEGDFTGRDAFDQRTEQRQYDQRSDNRIYDQRRDQRQYEQRDDSRGGSNVMLQMPPLQSQDSIALWQEIQNIGQKIHAVDFKLDDLPGRVGRLEVQIQPVPVPVVYVPPWMAILLIALGSIIVVGAAFVIGRGL